MIILNILVLRPNIVNDGVWICVMYTANHITIANKQMFHGGRMGIFDGDRRGLVDQNYTLGSLKLSLPYGGTQSGHRK